MSRLNELSNSMLKSYIRKAASDSATQAVDYGRSLANPKKVDMNSFNKLVKRQVGITTATQHMKNEETKPNTLQVIREAVHKKAHARHQAITRILTKHKSGVIDRATANAQLKSGGHPGLNKESFHYDSNNHEDWIKLMKHHGAVEFKTHDKEGYGHAKGDTTAHNSKGKHIGTWSYSHKVGWLHEETINETLPSNATTADYIHDFVHSKNSRFAGKSKAERIRQALGAYYNKRKSED